MDANVQDEGTSSMSAAGQSETAQSALDLQNPWPNLVPLFKLIAMGTRFVSSARYAFEDLVMLKKNKSLWS